MRKRTDLTFRLVALRRGQVSLPLFVWGDPDKIENHRKRENKIQGVALPRRSDVSDYPNARLSRASHLAA